MKKLAFLLLAGLPALLNAQTDDFNDGDDRGWREYDPLKSAPGVGTNIATFSFPNGGYRIQTYRTPNAAFGPARAGSLREDVTYTDFYITVDIVDWNTNLNQAFGIMARVSDVGFGTSDGYAMTWDRGGRDLDISRFVNENPSGGGGGGVPVSGPEIVNMVTGKVYRMVFIGKGTQLTGEMYELPDLDTPVASITGVDTAFTSGFCGVIVYDNASAATQAGTDTTFDNYFALPFRPPRMKIEALPFDELLVSWPMDPPDYVLQTTTTLGANWTDITEGIFDNGGRWYYADNSNGQEQRFYRLRPGP